MMPNSISRTGTASGSNQFVTQAVYCQPSQTANHSTAASTAPSRLRSSSSRCEICVTAKT